MSKQFGKVRSWLTWLDKRKKNLETPKEEANEKWAIESQKAQKLVPSEDRVWSRAQIRTVTPQSDSLPHFTIELSLLYLNSIVERTLFARETEPKSPHLGTWAETRQYMKNGALLKVCKPNGEAPCPFPPIGSRNVGNWASGDIWETSLKPSIVRPTTSQQALRMHRASSQL